MCLTIVICSLFKNGCLLNEQFGIPCLTTTKNDSDCLVHVPKSVGYSIPSLSNCQNFSLAQQPNDDFQVIQTFFSYQATYFCKHYSTASCSLNLLFFTPTFLRFLAFFKLLLFTHTFLLLLKVLKIYNLYSCCFL